MNNPRNPRPDDSQHGSYLGPEFSSANVRQELDRLQAVYDEFTDEDELAAAVAAELAEGKIVGHFTGRAEFGPRALGHRSILGDPRQPDMQSRMNVAIKFRESFRPFAPAVIKERQSDYFEQAEESPYMLIVFPLRNEQRRQLTTMEQKLSGVEMLKVQRSALPAVTHVDYSARVQTVSKERSPRFYRILRAFEQKTGCPVLVNTSFNIRGEPMVHTPADAYRSFMFTDMDVLVVENHLLRRCAQPPMAGAAEYRKQFKAD